MGEEDLLYSWNSSFPSFSSFGCTYVETKDLFVKENSQVNIQSSLIIKLFFFLNSNIGYIANNITTTTTR